MAFSSLFFRIIKHLNPLSRAFRLFKDRQITEFYRGLTGLPQDVRNYYDEIWLDIFPDTTREIELHEKEFGIIPSTSNEADRRNAIDAEWKAKGCQSSSCIEDLLQDAGFDVYVHEVIPAQDPNNFLLTGFLAVAGEPGSIAGEPNVVAGKSGGEVLVNGDLFTSFTKYGTVAGEPESIAGEIEAVAGEITGTNFDPIVYEIPIDSDTWPYFWYISNQTFPNFATVDAARESEFKSLVLKLKPVHTWAGLLINFA